ncbi:MAG TPA: hypothetical protein VH968_12560 [Gaiellaceae bacterium]
MRRAAALAALVALVLPAAAAAHGPGALTGSGYVASVRVVEPQILGLEARVIRNDELLVSNLTRKEVEILDRSGRPFIRLRPEGAERLVSGEWRRMNTGAAYAWHDSRVVGEGEPPGPAAGQPKDAPRFVRDWSVPGRVVGGRRFTIDGALAWIPPPQQSDAGTPAWVLVAGAAGLVALSLAALFFLGRRSES